MGGKRKTAIRETGKRSWNCKQAAGEETEWAESLERHGVSLLCGQELSQSSCLQIMI